MKSRLPVYYQPVRPPTWPSKNEGTHATGSDCLLCYKRKDHSSSHSGRDFGDGWAFHVVPLARFFVTTFTESASQRGRGLWQPIERLLCGALGDARFSPDRTPGMPPQCWANKPDRLAKLTKRPATWNNRPPMERNESLAGSLASFCRRFPAALSNFTEPASLEYPRRFGAR
jgi:hypothetical protein